MSYLQGSNMEVMNSHNLLSINVKKFSNKITKMKLKVTEVEEFVCPPASLSYWSYNTHQYHTSMMVYKL